MSKGKLAAKFKGGNVLAALALPVLLAAFGIVWVTLELLDTVSTVANRTDHNRTSQVVQSAFAAEISALKDIVSDNSQWDDAAKVAYGSMDEDWIFNTWGVLSGENHYDQILLIDPTNPMALAAYAKGEKTNINWRRDIGPGLQHILDSLPKASTETFTAGSIVISENKPAVVAAAYVFPTTENLVGSIERPRALVMLRYLDDARIAKLSEQYVINELQISTEKRPSNSTENEIRDIGQNVVAYVKWKDFQPGNQAKQAASGITALALGLLVFVVLAIGVVCWKLVKAIAKREAEAVRTARLDPLTGLPNRLAITEAMTANAANQTDYVVAFADLDGFKEVNDTYDHETGDQLLQAVAAGMQHLVADKALLARLGGDEFIAMFIGANALGAATKFSHDLISFINKPFNISGRHTHVGVSVGIACSECQKNTPAEIMRQADVAMYQAKSSGKNSVSLYNCTMDDTRDAAMIIAKDLGRYLAEDKICLVYQPIIDASTHQIFAVEALARWPDDAPTRIPPDQFVAIAEQKGLIDALGETVLRKACAQLKDWPHINMNVNISPLELNNPAFVERTLAIITSFGIDPARIEIELTEGHLLEDMTRTMAQFEKLRAHGIRIALDDFGSGYASLGYLQKLEFDSIKIDKVISNQFDSGTKGLRIVQATALLAKGVASKVVAEGIESAEQGNILRLSGCSHLQGFHYHKPKSAAEITELLDQQNALPFEVRA
jgi:diguanylate cyclase (GGDEF)-like protein